MVLLLRSRKCLWSQEAGRHRRRGRSRGQPRSPWPGRGDDSRASGRAAHAAWSQHRRPCLAHVEAGEQHAAKAQEYVEK